jgi:plastocyanin
MRVLKPLPALKRLRGLALPLAAIALAAGAGLLSSNGAPTSAATKYTAYAGGGRAGISVDMFRPGTLIVNAGDSVEFMNPYEEIHTVTYVVGAEPSDDWFALSEEVPFIIPVGPPPAAGPPKLAINPQAATPVPTSGAATIDGSAFANSGIIGKGQSFTATFPKEGSFKLICVLHPMMEVNVQAIRSGATVPTQALIDAEAATSLADQLAKGEASAAAAKPGPDQVIQAPSVEFASVNRFIPPRLQIDVGDTVTWKNDTFVPHTITFNAAGPSFLAPEPQPSGPPLLVLDPKVLFPVKSSQNFDGSGYVNSGFIGAGPEATGGTSFSLTFTKAGTYSYICMLHADQGMAGVIEVGAGGGTVTPPSTGDAGLADTSGRSNLVYAIVLLPAVLIAAGAVWRLRVRV